MQGLPILGRAAVSGDEGVMRMLIDRGANRNPLSRDLGLRSGCVRCAELLLESAGHEDLNWALTTASLFSDSKSVKILLDRGADASAVVSTPVVSDGGVSGRALAPSGNQSARSAVQKSLPVPQHADIAFLKKAGCGVDTIGYILAGLASTRYQPDEATHALARYLLRMADGVSPRNVRLSNPAILRLLK